MSPSSTLDPHNDILKIHAVSLNYREIDMLMGTCPMSILSSGIPCSDAAAEVVDIGGSVTRFKVGDRVAPNTSIGDFEPDDDGAAVGVGTSAEGVLREYAVFPGEAFGAFAGAFVVGGGGYGLECVDGLKYVPKSATALLQSTGGVSMFALILCLSAGVRSIITSSSDEKLEAIKELSSEILGFNYKMVADQGAEVKRLTKGRGVDFVVNNTGPKSLMDEIGFLYERGGTVSTVDFLQGGITMGSKADFEEMNRYIEGKKIRFDPLVVDAPFSFVVAEAAYDRLGTGKFHGKIIIKT